MQIFETAQNKRIIFMENKDKNISCGVDENDDYFIKEGNSELTFSVKKINKEDLLKMYEYYDKKYEPVKE